MRICADVDFKLHISAAELSSPGPERARSSGAINAGCVRMCVHISLCRCMSMCVHGYIYVYIRFQISNIYARKRESVCVCA